MFALFMSSLDLKSHISVSMLTGPVDIFDRRALHQRNGTVSVGVLRSLAQYITSWVVLLMIWWDLMPGFFLSGWIKWMHLWPKAVDPSLFCKKSTLSTEDFSPTLPPAMCSYLGAASLWPSWILEPMSLLYFFASSCPFWSPLKRKRKKQ